MIHLQCFILLVNLATRAKVKVRKYSIDYLNYGFTAAPHYESLRMCLICNCTLCSDSMKPVKLEQHLKTKHNEHAKKPLKYFKDLKKNR